MKAGVKNYVSRGCQTNVQMAAIPESLVVDLQLSSNPGKSCQSGKNQILYSGISEHTVYEVF